MKTYTFVNKTVYTTLSLTSSCQCHLFWWNGIDITYSSKDPDENEEVCCLEISAVYAFGRLWRIWFQCTVVNCCTCSINWTSKCYSVQFQNIIQFPYTVEPHYNMTVGKLGSTHWYRIISGHMFPNLSLLPDTAATSRMSLASEPHSQYTGHIVYMRL